MTAARLLLIAALIAPALALGQSQPLNQATALPPDLSQASPVVDRRVWQLTPIEIVLPVNRERLVTFTAPIQLEMPAKLDGQTLRTQIVADTHSGTIYWTALKPFERQRIQVQDLASQAYYLVDLIASPAAQDTTRIEIVVPQATAAAETPPAPATTATAPEPPAAPDPVALTRMAAQFCYAPARLVKPLDGVSRTAVSHESTASLLHGAQVQATPIMAWRSGDWVVTAVKLKNLTPTELILDPRKLRGAWLTASFQHNLLKPAGDLRDTTALYLISHDSFARSLHGHQ